MSDEKEVGEAAARSPRPSTQHRCAVCKNAVYEADIICRFCVREGSVEAARAPRLEPQSITQQSAHRSQTELAVRLRLHAHDLVNGGTNAGDLQKDLRTAADQLNEAARALREPLEPFLELKQPTDCHEVGSTFALTGDRLLSTIDGAMWAKEFCRVTGFTNEAWALAWFCNAIAAGFDSAWRIDLREGQAVAVPTPDVHSEFVAAAPREPLEPYVHDAEACGCENDAPWCPLNPHATEVKPYDWVTLAAARSALPPLDDGGVAETERRHAADCRDQEAQRQREADALQAGFEAARSALPQLHIDIAQRLAALEWVLNRAEEIVRDEHGKDAAYSFEQAWGELPKTLRAALPRAPEPDLEAFWSALHDWLYSVRRTALSRSAEEWQARIDALRASRGEARVPHEETEGDARVETGATTPSTGSTANSATGDK